MKHIFILRLIRKEDGSLISERDMDTMAEKDKDEAVNELNGNSVGYLREYRGVTATMYRSLRGHMPEELAKEVLVSITKEAIKQAEEKR